MKNIVQLVSAQYRNALGIMLIMVVYVSVPFVIPTGQVHASLASQLVPCGNQIEYGGDANSIWYYGECDVCHLVELGMNVLNFLIVIMVAVAALIFVNAGWLYITSPGNSGNIARAHKLFTNTLMGILVILVAYLLIDTVMRVLISGNLSVEANINGYGPWNEILCEGMEDVMTIDGERAYRIKKLSSIDLNASVLVLPLVSCESIGGTGCASECPEGYGGVSGTQCAGSTPMCCVPNTSGSTYLGRTCVLHVSGYEDSPASCTTVAACGDREMAVDPAQCGPDLVCCQGTTSSTPPPVGTCGDSSLAYSCDDTASLTARFCGAGPINTPELDQMIACYRNDPEVRRWLSTQPIYTYDNSYPLCNYTNGQRVCGACSHSAGGCHYGAGLGRGSMAADFNGTDEKQLLAALRAAQPRCGGRILDETNTRYPHTHIKTDSCPATW